MSFVDQYNSMSDVGQAVNPSAPTYGKPKQKQETKKKGPGGLAGFLVNSLPAITSGIGAVGGSFLAPVAGTVAGGAAGGALGESIKRKILGEKQDLGQIAIQGVEGGVLSGVGNAFKGATKGAQALTKLGANTAEKEVASTAAKTAASDSKGTFLKNLTTQGQQAQGRVSGVSAGSKVAGRELTPQDTERMLRTLKQENIATGNANNTLRDVTDKLKTYGTQISDHFKTNNNPLKSEDTKVIADNFISGLKTTDPSVLKQAEIVANDLQKNVKSTKDLWNFRKTLDSRIPDSKFMDDATTTKVAALKSMRQYISDELGQVPGMKNYHDLAEIKPFVTGEAKRLNNPGGGIVGRVLSSGPAQKLENAVGKGVERVGSMGSKSSAGVADNVAAEFPSTARSEPQNILDKVLTSKGIPVKYESDKFIGQGMPESRNVTLTNPNVQQLEEELSRMKDAGFDVSSKLGRTPGSLNEFNGERGLTPQFTPIHSSPKLSSVALKGNKTSIPLSQTGKTERGIINTANKYENRIPDSILQDASDATRSLPGTGSPVSPSFLQKLVGAAANPIANPGQTAGAVLKQEAGRGFGVSAMLSDAQQASEADAQNAANDLATVPTATSTSQEQTPSNDPYSPVNVQANVQAILKQGGTQKDVSEYLANVESYSKLTSPSNGGLNSTAAGVVADTTTGLSQLQKLSSDIAESSVNDPGLGYLRSKNPFDTSAQNLQASIATAKQIVGKALEGGVLRAEDEKKYAKILPTINDTDQVAQYKIQQLVGLIGSRLNEYKSNLSGGSGGTDLSSLGL
jgi:hypothetical protein